LDIVSKQPTLFFHPGQADQTLLAVILQPGVIYNVDPGKVTSYSDAKVFVALEVVGVDVDCVGEVLVVLPYIRKVYVESAPFVVLT
jgi:hypothetical protein